MIALIAEQWSKIGDYEKALQLFQKVLGKEAL
jgi:hypothetical protein